MKKEKNRNKDALIEKEIKKPQTSNHEEFKLGQGYGSGEAESEYQSHPSKKQYGDNPIPKSGGGYSSSGNAQPAEKSE